MTNITYKQLEKKIISGTVEMTCDLIGTYKNIAEVRTRTGKITSYYLIGKITPFFNKK